MLVGCFDRKSTHFSSSLSPPIEALPACPIMVAGSDSEFACFACWLQEPIWRNPRFLTNSDLDGLICSKLYKPLQEPLMTPHLVFFVCAQRRTWWRNLTWAFEAQWPGISIWLYDFGWCIDNEAMLNVQTCWIDDDSWVTWAVTSTLRLLFEVLLLSLPECLLGLFQLLDAKENPLNDGKWFDSYGINNVSIFADILLCWCLGEAQISTSKGDPCSVFFQIVLLATTRGLGTAAAHRTHGYGPQPAALQSSSIQIIR